MRREVGRFEAKADNGQQFTIVEYQDVITTGTRDDPHATDPEAIACLRLMVSGSCSSMREHTKLSARVS